MGDQILTPNTQLFVVLGLFFVGMTVVALAFMLIRKRLLDMEQHVGPVTPLWRHVLAELSAIMRHPHAWAKEMDALLDEANLEPEITMDPARYERLLVLLAERVASKNPEVTDEDRAAAATYLAVLPLVRRDDHKRVELSGIKLVGTVAPDAESVEDEDKHNEATEKHNEATE